MKKKNKKFGGNSKLPRNVGLPSEKFVEGLEDWFCVEIWEGNNHVLGVNQEIVGCLLELGKVRNERIAVW